MSRPRCAAAIWKSILTVYSPAPRSAAARTSPEIFRACLNALGTAKSETAVFEDAIHAARTAKRDGFVLVGVYDKSEKRAEELKALSDCYITDLLQAGNIPLLCIGLKWSTIWKTALTIAGSDSSGGAGIQADIKTMTMNGVFAMSAITALTAQNTTGVSAIEEASPEFLRQQLDAVFEDIYPDAVKIGMVSSSELIRVIADRLRHYDAKNIVVDPVMVATSGSALMKTDAVQTLADELFPISTVITPNIPEGEILSGMKIENEEVCSRLPRR